MINESGLMKKLNKMHLGQLMAVWRKLYELGKVEWNDMYDNESGLMKKLNKFYKEK